MEHTTASGLIVHSRAVLPRDYEANAEGAGPNSPPVSVGPTSSEGFGNTHVLYNESGPPPPGVMAWSGWPVGWDTPDWGPPGWLAQRTSTVGTCCDTIGRTVAQFPPLVMTGPTVKDPQPLWTLNPEPGLYASWDEWVRGAVNSLLLRGEVFLAATGRNAEGFPTRWITLNPDGVTVDLDGGRLTYRLGERDLDPADILHVKHQATPGNLRGVGPLEWASRNLYSAGALADFGAGLAARGGVPWAWLQHPGTLAEGQATTIRDQWNEAQPLRAGAPAILSGGMTLNTLSINPEQMTLLGLREFDEQRIAAAFGVPPSYVNLPQPNGLTYNTAQMIREHFYWDTLRPLSHNLAAGISNWALPYKTNLVLDATEYVAPLSPGGVPAGDVSADALPAATGQPTPIGVTE